MLSSGSSWSHAATAALPSGESSEVDRCKRHLCQWRKTLEPIELSPYEKKLFQEVETITAQQIALYRLRNDENGDVVKCLVYIWQHDRYGDSNSNYGKSWISYFVKFEDPFNVVNPMVSSMNLGQGRKRTQNLQWFLGELQKSSQGAEESSAMAIAPVVSAIGQTRPCAVAWTSTARAIYHPGNAAMPCAAPEAAPSAAPPTSPDAEERRAPAKPAVVGLPTALLKAFRNEVKDPENYQSFDVFFGDFLHELFYGEIKTLDMKVQAQEREIQHLREHVRKLEKRLEDFIARGGSDFVPETIYEEDGALQEVNDLGGQEVTPPEPEVGGSDFVPETIYEEDGAVQEVNDLGGEEVTPPEPEVTSSELSTTTGRVVESVEALFMARGASDCVLETMSGEGGVLQEVNDLGGEKVALSAPSTTSPRVEGRAEGFLYQ